MNTHYTMNINLRNVDNIKSLDFHLSSNSNFQHDSYIPQDIFKN